MSLQDNDADDISLESFMEQIQDGRAEDTHTSLIGVVDRYVAGEQVADVRPLIKRVVPTVDGGTVSESHPIIRAVPLIWPRAGDWFIHMPLSAGDTVLMICLDRDIARWRQTGEEADPVDQRVHHIAHSVAIPGIYARTRQLGDTPPDALVIGRDGGATIRVKMDGTVQIGSSGASEGAGLGDSIKAYIDAHKHAYINFPAGISTPALTSPPTLLPAGTPLDPAPAGSSVVKVDP